MGFFNKLRKGLEKTRKNISEKIDKMLISFGKIDEELFEELEEILIISDVGVETTLKIVENIKSQVKEKKITDPMSVKSLLKDELVGILKERDEENNLIKDSIPEETSFPSTVMVIIGVNGVGKTTSIGKVAANLKNQGKKVVLAAADTFRAAAIEQLEIWANKAGVGIIKHSEGSDPAAVVYDAIQASRARKTNVLICDTAGRLHTKKNLMEELKKIFRVITRELPETNIETLLVLDATTGQNAVSQAKVFSDATNISGIILTKLDGTAKGGIIIAIKSELGIPVKLVGVGENIDDLQPFNPCEFVEAMLYENEKG